MERYKFMQAEFELPVTEDNTKKVKVHLDATTSTVMDIHKWYERAYTAEYIMDNEYYCDKCEGKEDIAYNVACKVRDVMDDNPSFTEEEALRHVFFETEFNINDYRS